MKTFLCMRREHIIIYSNKSESHSSYDEIIKIKVQALTFYINLSFLKFIVVFNKDFPILNYFHFYLFYESSYRQFHTQKKNPFNWALELSKAFFLQKQLGSTLVDIPCSQSLSNRSNKLEQHTVYVFVQKACLLFTFSSRVAFKFLLYIRSKHLINKLETFRQYFATLCKSHKINKIQKQQYLCVRRFLFRKAQQIETRGDTDSSNMNIRPQIKPGFICYKR